ncbi:hypothetical protein CKO25_15865 [Thiocapsa imhoffii]|uniref:Alginate export domain-containing protein n=1 Tax=Thiocapsa imhoffii TaxID=382777 RepID=A0A9X1B9P8_9GAMM|nr:alginate export family protein [Thiocapsa imhoffii]MBK1646097.1 hypothetical protein [Thiocapsa imhoffii]
MNSSGHATRIALALGLAVSAATSGANPGHEPGTVSSFKPGADLRLRQVFIGNVGLNDQSPIADRTFQRYRGRIWGLYAPTEQIVGTARLMWEGRHYNKPKADQWPVPGFETWYSGGLFFDLLEVAFNDIAGAPLSVKLGRQEIVLGNGWLVLEGTPLDGSRTIYFDAARATYKAASIATTFELIYINQDATTDRFPRPLNGVIEDQIEQYETGVILYARNQGLLPDTELDGYVIYKDSRPDNTPGNIRVNNGAPFPSPPDSGTAYTIGVRAESKWIPNWTLRGEGAYQWGTRNDADLDAFGFNARATYHVQDPRTSRLHLGYEFLSGNKPNHQGTQAFDPLWGRWPQWSELMIYQWPLESRVAEATNLSRLNLGWATQVHPTTLLTLDYHALWADEMTTRTPAQLVNLSGESRFRGHLATAWLRTKFNSHLAAHLVAEYLWPGDYYAVNRRDESYFVRAELNLSW